MNPKSQKEFTSPRDVFEACFPDSADKNRTRRTGTYGSPPSDAADRLAERFAENIAKKHRR